MNTITAVGVAAVIAKAEANTKFTDDDMTTELRQFAEGYTRSSRSDSAYIISMREALARYGYLTVGQARGIMNCALASYKRKLAETNPATLAFPKVYELISKAASPKLKYPTITVPTSDGDGSFILRWTPDRTAVRILSSEREWNERYQSDARIWYGEITATGSKFGARCPAAVCELLAKLEAGDTATMLAELGRLSGSCCFCGRELTTSESTTVGYGPICAGHYGLPWGHVVAKARPTKRNAVGTLRERLEAPA